MAASLLAAFTFILTHSDTPIRDKDFSHHKLVNYQGETITLSSQGYGSIGATMPAIGYGTCCRKTAKGNAIYKSTLLFLNNGGRLIDTAMAYKNHNEIGKAIQDSGIPRNEIWITSKIAVNKVLGKGSEATVQAVKNILKELNVGSYLDLCLIHTQKLGKKESIQIWKGLIQAHELGIVRTIGVSNFNKHEMLDLQKATGLLPQINQIQYHPWTVNEWKELVQWQTENGIATTAYNSLGGSRFHSVATWTEILRQLAKKYSATEAQLLLRWALDHKNVAVIPGASSEDHIKENLNIPMFRLTDEDREALENADAPEGWWDPERGPVKYLAEEADRSWMGDHTISGKK